MSDLKTKIARGEYEIDSREVAEAILAKLRTVRRVRTHLLKPQVETGGRQFAAAWRGERRRATL